MPKPLIIIPDQEWDDVQKEIQDERHSIQTAYKLGYIINRYTDLDVQLEQDEKGYYLGSKSGTDILSLVKRIAKMWL